MDLSLDREGRGRLRAALRDRYPWVDDPHWGPSAVEAGQCDRCGGEARLVMTCGPGGVYLGRSCVDEMRATAWCAGHDTDAAAAVLWTAGLPPEADTVARLWWVATGEVRLGPGALVHALRQLPPE